MATTSGALRRLLVDRGEVLKRDLIAFVPINVRGEGDAATLGNQISGMLVALHADIADPGGATEGDRAGLRQDRRRATRAPGAKMFQDDAAGARADRPFLGRQIRRRVRTLRLVPPMANLMLSSVPGPPIPCG